MATTTYRVTVDGEARFEFTADLAQASAPILLNGRSTPYQTADARHDEREAAEMLALWAHNEGGSALSVDEDGDIDEEFDVEEIDADEAETTAARHWRD